MEIQELASGVWVVPGAVNMGLVKTDAGLVAVDTGLDKRAGKTLLRAANELGMPICAIVNTHAHADHFGGNAQILVQQRVPVYAPSEEAAVIRRPRFEPEYLWQGAVPFPELQNKFLMADSSPVDVELQTAQAFDIGGCTFQTIALPGHAHGQIGLVVRGVFFAADAYFDAPVVDKHGLPFMVDFTRTLTSAKQVADVEASWVVPGHGVPATDPRQHIQYLVERHQTAYEALLLHVEGGAPFHVLMKRMCARFDLNPSNAGLFLLLRTTVAAYVTAAVDEGIITVDISDGDMLFSAAH